MYYHNLGQIYFWLRDWENCYQNKKESILLFEKNISFEQDKITAYLVDIGFIIGALVSLKRYDELLIYKNKASKFIQLIPKNKQNNSTYNAYMVVMVNYIAYQVDSFKINEALAECEKLESIIQKFLSAQPLKVFYYNLFMIYFYKDNFRKALYCINKILAEEGMKARQDVWNVAKITNIIVHYELGNLDLLPGLCRSTLNYFEKKGVKNKGDKLLLDHFAKESVKDPRPEERIKRFTELRKKIIDLPNSDFFIQKDLVVPWLNSKIEKISFLEATQRHRKG